MKQVKNWIAAVCYYYMWSACKLSSEDVLVIYQDNVACIPQFKGGYVKGDKIKHISPKFFYTYERHKIRRLI